MDIIELCKQQAIEFYKQNGVDILTKEKRVAMSEDDKKQLFNLLTQLYMGARFRGI